MDEVFRPAFLQKYYHVVSLDSKYSKAKHVANISDVTLSLQCAVLCSQVKQIYGWNVSNNMLKTCLLGFSRA